LIAYDDGHFHFAGWPAWEQGFFSQWLGLLKVETIPLFLVLWLLPGRNNKLIGSAELSAGSTFDLAEAWERWQRELAAQPQLMAEDRRELERHLSDLMAELRGRGLSEAEAFRQAVQRMGSPRQLAEEFEKADPAKAWRERLFWAAVGALVFWQVSLVMTYTVDIVIRLPLFIPGLARFYPGRLLHLSDLLLLLTAILAIRGRMRWVSKPASLFHSRIRLAVLLVFLAVLCSWEQMILIRIMDVQGNRPWVDMGTWLGFCLRMSFRYLEFGAGPLILAVWFLPKSYRKASRPVCD
jgi:hypothetical protein